MALQYGLYAESQQSGANVPHILSFLTARTAAGDTLFEVWNGSTNAARAWVLGLNGEQWSANGTAAAPVYSFLSDPDSGFYRIGANNVGLSLGGAKLLDFSASAVALAAASAVITVTSSTGTNSAYQKFHNTGGDFYVGRNGSAAGGLLLGSSAYAGVLSAEGAYSLEFGTNTVLRLRMDDVGNLVVGTAALATNAANGFFYIPSSAGAPTGTPTAFTGRVPLHYDATNHKFYVYDGGWKGVAVS